MNPDAKRMRLIANHLLEKLAFDGLHWKQRRRMLWAVQALENAAACIDAQGDFIDGLPDQEF